MGAWIETQYRYQKRLAKLVAPYVGAWIETEFDALGYEVTPRSHPMWVRGLKLYQCPILASLVLSHPMWVRGLKHGYSYNLKSVQSRTLCGCVD